MARYGSGLSFKEASALDREQILHALKGEMIGGQGKAAEKESKMQFIEKEALDAVISSPEVEREPEAAPAFYQETEALILFLKSAANRLAVSGNVNQEVQAVIHDLLYKANSLKNQQRMIRRAYEREEKHAPGLGTHHGADDV